MYLSAFGSLSKTSGRPLNPRFQGVASFVTRFTKVRFEISIQKPGNYIFNLELMCPKERLSEKLWWQSIRTAVRADS